MKAALTGGIGCGKSTALRAFRNHDCATVSADALGHEILSESSSAAFVVARFGAECAPAGTVDRERLARVVFADPAARKELEDFIHPKIEAAWRERVRAAEERGEDCVVEIPLLFEKNLEGAFDRTVCLVCSEAVQLERLEKRGLPRERALARIAAQLPIEEKARRADVCLFNDGSPEFLEKQIAIFAKNFLN
ncbi:dephospho-CoA kinase [Candidatus Spyradosoma sp. SGI.093]|uniref:dephospho-CoA kinase n=1 Tax=Candidatus Spyradosoma sp. SGI.093 TaxID=3420583 RepID=UPI003D05DA9A